MTPAAKLRTAIVRELKRVRAGGVPIEWTHYPGGPNARRGEPDLHVTVAGRSLWIEIKAGRDRLTELQRRRIAQWQQAGAVAGTVSSLDELRRLVDQARA